MCGRYQFTAEQCEEIRQIAESIQCKYGKGSWSPGEIRPTANAPVLVAEGDAPGLQLMKWGYQLQNSLVINARAETATQKPLFRESVKTRRCLIPSTGFYEWDSRKHKYLFTLPGEPVLYMAGLYELREGEDCYCILTTAPNASMRPVHDRMPLVIPREKMQDWLIDGTAALSMLSMRPPELLCQSVQTQISLW